MGGSKAISRSTSAERHRRRRRDNRTIARPGWEPTFQSLRRRRRWCSSSLAPAAPLGSWLGVGSIVIVRVRLLRRRTLAPTLGTRTGTRTSASASASASAGTSGRRTTDLVRVGVDAVPVAGSDGRVKEGLGDDGHALRDRIADLLRVLRKLGV